MPYNSDSGHPELIARIRELEEETARLQRLIAELVLKNQHLRRDIRAAGVWECTWIETEDDHAGMGNPGLTRGREDVKKSILGVSVNLAR